MDAKYTKSPCRCCHRGSNALLEMLGISTANCADLPDLQSTFYFLRSYRKSF